ncbi:MAG: hypothetical protein JO307_27440 [Bryobacterales bacterium]|nr:hypothetical protein [Bryobacterales bacterium]MBV9397251.1 hypothetical protein [Bryobacterales bacterium]
MNNFSLAAGILTVFCATGFGQEFADPAAQAPAPPPPAQQTPGAPPAPAQQNQNPRQINAKPDNTAPDDIDNVYLSFKAYYWLTNGTFNMRSGVKAVSPGDSTLPTLGDATKHNLGGQITFPAGKYNRLEVSYYQAHANGTSTAPQNLTFFGQNIPSGDFLSTSLRVRSLDVTWNYLTWPDPPENARLRIKTLWGFQWRSVQSIIDAPFETSATFSPAVGTINIFYPELGIGAEYVLSKYVYLDGRASGFAWPHRAVVWDADGNLVLRYKFVEVFGGYKASHLKTSPQGEEYVVGTFKGAYAGLRIVWR